MDSGKDTFDALTKDRFKKWSQFYDLKANRLLYFDRVYGRIIEIIKDEFEIQLKPKSKFLDVACGTGEIIFRLAKEFPQVEFVGVDFSERMLDKAVKKTEHLQNVKIIQANVRDLPFSDKSFDIILCSASFHHFVSPEDSLQEINRIARQGSLFFLVDPAFDTIFQKIIIGLFGKVFDFPKKYYSKKEIDELLQSTDFIIKSSFTYHLTNFFICRQDK